MIKKQKEPIVLEKEEEITIRRPTGKEFFHYLFIGLITLSGFLIFFNIFFGVLAAYYSFAYITNSQNLINSMPSFFIFWSITWIILAFSLIGVYLSRRKDD